MDVVDLVLRHTKLPPDDATMERLGWRMAALYRVWQCHLDVSGLIAGLVRHTGLTDTSPLARTARATAAALAEWGGHPYHSICHHAEVATSAMVLAALRPSPLAPSSLGLLLCGALAHDLNFEPDQASSGRFAAERRSANALDALAASEGVATADRDSLRLLVLATEPMARKGLRALLRQGIAHPDAEVRELGARPDLLALAALLSDADLLSSSGLNESWQAVQQDRLGREWRRKVTRADQITYFRDILGPDYLSPSGRLFAANLQRIRATALPARSGAELSLTVA